MLLQLDVECSPELGTERRIEIISNFASYVKIPHSLLVENLQDDAFSAPVVAYVKNKFLISFQNF